MNETIPAPAAAALADARNKLQQLGGCALLIGVEAYDGLPADKQLLAGRNDVLAYWKVCRRLGYRPEHIRMLTSPVLTVDDLVRAEQDLGPELHPGRSNAEIRARVERWFAGPAPVVLGDASRDAIVQGVAWLATKLVFTVKLAWDDGKLEHELAALPGLLAYSGHGAHHQGDLVLCPADVGPGLERAVAFAELRALIDAGDDIKAQGTPHPADNLTVVLDCCFAAAGEASRALRVPTLTPGGSGPVPAPKREIGSRVFCAAGRDEQAYQGMLGGRWHGAFTWAFTRALEQWETAPSGQFRKSTISHVELLFRARMLLEALSFRQHPVLVDRIGNLPVFQHDADEARDTSAEPDAARLVGQIDPSDGFAHYQFLDASSAVLAEVVATDPESSDPPRWGMERGREYWKINSARFNSSDHPTLGARKLASGRWSTAGRAPFTSEQASFSCPVVKIWYANKGGTLRFHKPSDSDHGGLKLMNLSFDRARGSWTGAMAFFRCTERLLFQTMAPNTTRTLTRDQHTYTQWCDVPSSEFRDSRAPGIFSGDQVVLHDTERDADLRKAYWTSGDYYATHDQSGGAQAHKLTLVTGSADLITSGSEIYIQSTEGDLLGYYLRPGGYRNDLYYQSGSTPGRAHTWIIKKSPSAPDGALIQRGDTVIFLSKEDSNRSMACNSPGGSDSGYLSVTESGTALRPWKIS